jgi:hypothetical protein
MRDDHDGEENRVPTVPPPDGESDVYDAATRVGGLSPEALAMLRQVRDEKPTGAVGELNLPVFEDAGEGETTVKRAASAAAAAALSSPRPAAGMPATRAAAPTPAPIAPPAVAPSELRPIAAAEPARAPDPPKKASLPPLIAVPAAAVSDLAEPESYEAVFAPLPPSTATPETGGGAPRPQPATAASPALPIVLIISGVAVGVLVVLAFVLMAKAGFIPGLGPRR